jgi:hypothetical protein
VEFKEAPAGRGTVISSRMQFTPASGMGGTLARFLNKGASFAMRQDMRRLEAMMETGEIPTTEGQPHGPRDVTTAVMRLADPTRPVSGSARLRDVFAARRGIA